MTPDPDPGNQIFSFPQWGNWPFAVLIVIIAVAASTPFIIDGDWRAVAIIVVAVLAFPLAIGAIAILPAILGHRRVVAVHARGIMWARLWQHGFIPWSNLERVKGPPLWEFNERRGRGEPIELRLADAEVAGPFIAERLPKK